jgi:PadR family transcriptional regulator PadR
MRDQRYAICQTHTFTVAPNAAVPASRAPHPDRTLFTAWLLLLLIDDESYGWALANALRERGISVAAGLTYRRLQELERDDALVSRWAKSETGPSRRCYSLTPAGRSQLAECAEVVRSVWELHDAFVRAHERAVGNQDDALDVPADAAGDGAQHQRPSRPGRELLAAWLLLLLEHGASYGYELRRELDVHRITADPATLYRILRQLEGSGWLESRWMRPAAGPRRRFYRVTGRGRRNLEELAVVIERIRDTHAVFLEAYAAASGASAHSASE